MTKEGGWNDEAALPLGSRFRGNDDRGRGYCASECRGALSVLECRGGA